MIALSEIAEKSQKRTEARLADAFKTRTLTFAAPDAPFRVDREQQQQRALWQELLGALPATENVHRNLQSTAIQNLSTRGDVFAVRDIPDGKALNGTIPLISRETVDQLKGIANDEPSLVWAAVVVECAALYQGQNLNNILTLPFLVDIVGYLTGGTLPKDLSALISTFGSRVNTSISQARDAESDLRDQIEKTQSTTRAFIDDQTKGLESFKRALSEDIKLKAGSSLWESRARWHRSAFFVWFAVFAASVIALLFYIVEHMADLAGAIPKEPDGHFSYVSVAFVLIPALGAAWLLRLISRFVNSNQILADNARHRQAMTRAYLALVADPDSEVTEKDRLVMLTAIFRPLPGGHAEDVSPPSILDILKKET